MTIKTTFSATVMAATIAAALPQASFAEAPQIKTVGPIIHLADNLDEEAKLGWCIDTDGRELTDLAQAHSCKPNGDDVLFAFSAETGMIESATYADICLAHNDPENPINPFGLIACDAADPAQHFTYDEASMEIHLASDATQCLTVNAVIDDAGPYQSRDLIAAACDTLEPSFKQWVIKDYSK
ncbi:ricin-type beta-trefoil lectin domain protein [Sulfitobacter donghicola]|uniref:Ricin B lectin domain-containing protein n=1 Tax=Sulfitobacter donghicola DSW-25 = KCTC 12864 = JCM 14565 TaxID=1300350 RepID=A0A073IH79_9RHOB|nr:ricin-type beta-trefoil lectin domain protein [Sulfitobacter donghicola]KEJ88871.1 hypothetical protein DSW25_13255 [Sulfitobacter donghicola DSW-25 = KCTC 12864 = JCM 14565]KIN68392.1 hypothetical protein Z948_2122 [Sulfitobacter donghicola DSW-25 = KCTC 12864 = JCM 14565]